MMTELTKEEMTVVSGGKESGSIISNRKNGSIIPNRKHGEMGWYNTVEALETSTYAMAIKNLISLKKNQGSSIETAKAVVNNMYGSIAPQSVLSEFVNKHW